MHRNEPQRPHARADGFTLLELLVVAGVLAVLFGLGVGFLGKPDPRGVAEATIQAELRAARLTARAEGLPTFVTITPGEPGRPATVQARVLQPVVTFAFEPGQRQLAPELEPQLGGVDEPRGRFGHARRSSDGDSRPLLRWVLPPSELAQSGGLALRFDLLLDRRAACTLLRLGRSLEFGLDAAGRPKARCTPRGTGGQGGAAVALQAQAAVPVGRWLTLDLVTDGQSCYVTLDGRELDRRAMDGPLWLPPDATLELSPPDAPVPGAIDELRVFAYVENPALYLPLEVQPAARYLRSFDARGNELPAPPIELQITTDEGVR